MTPHLTPKDVADIFGISEYQVRDRCRRGQWPHLRVGRAFRFTKEDVRAITELHAVPVDHELAAARSWGRKTRRMAASP